MTAIPARPAVFDTSAESWFGRTPTAAARAWMGSYVTQFPVFVSAVTVLERLRGFSRLYYQASEEARPQVDAIRLTYLNTMGSVLPVDAAVAAIAAELMGLLPQPPGPPTRSHQSARSRNEHLAGWRFDVLIAATALNHKMPLVHNNAKDFEAIRAAVDDHQDRFPRQGSLELIRCTALTIS